MKYTKKQIQESIKHWQKFLKENFNNVPTMNDLIEMLKEEGCDFDKPIFINPDMHYNSDVCDIFLKNCIETYGKDATLDTVKKNYNNGNLLDLINSINLYCSFGPFPKLRKVGSDQVIQCDLPEDGVSYMKI